MQTGHGSSSEEYLSSAQVKHDCVLAMQFTDVGERSRKLRTRRKLGHAYFSRARARAHSRGMQFWSGAIMDFFESARASTQVQHTRCHTLTRNQHVTTAMITQGVVVYT